MGSYLKIGVILLLLIVFGQWQYGKRTSIDPTHNWVGIPITATTYVHANIEDVSQLYWTEVENDGKMRHGWSIWYPEDKECVIHTVQVAHGRDRDSLVTLGHEYLHCLYGSWHPE